MNFEKAHLSVTEIKVDNGEVLQIVCGAANIRKGLKVVVAKPGAMMPDGLLIWPGELRGVESFGMVCSAKELNLDPSSISKVCKGKLKQTHGYKFRYAVVNNKE